MNQRQQAIFYGNLPQLQHLITPDTNIDDPHLNGETLLHFACLHGHNAMVAWLLSKGANAQLRIYDGRSTVHCGAQGGDPECLHLVLNAGADPMAVNTMGITPLHVAVKFGYLESCHILLATRHIGVDAKDRKGRNALYWSLFRKDRKLFKMLLHYGAKLANVEWDEYVQQCPKWATDILTCRNACRDTSMAILQLRKRNGEIFGNNRDVLGMIAYYVWAHRSSDECLPKEPQSKKQMLF